MKLLIVDDEELTRTGLMTSIDWASLGIREVYQADDGRNGLAMARLHKPEIILCDVRMPRMDGISMLSQLEELLPNTVSIFMSGYSDKEYLKAAIKLKAVTYIEKPLNLTEVQEAIAEARERYIKNLRSARAQTLQSMAVSSRLALKLTVPYNTASGDISLLMGQLSFPGSHYHVLTAFLVKLHTDIDMAGGSIREIFEDFQKYLQPFHMDCIYAEKKMQYLVYFVLGETAPSPSLLQGIGIFLQNAYREMGEFYIAAGESVTGLSRAYESYTSAVILLQNAFFYPPGAFLTPLTLSEGEVPSSQELLASPEELLSELLEHRNQEECGRFLQSLYAAYDRSHRVLPNQVRDLYYKLFLTLDETRKQQQIPYTRNTGHQTIADALEECFSYEELHRSFADKMQEFLLDAQNASQENPTILLIKEYISRHYSNEALSVKDISAHVFLSASYVCTFFKNETGQTLNQYLTEYRMKKAKQLLGDPRYKIADISSKVGYSDGNYFGKSFKKYTGLSPSEYREHIGS